MRNSLVELAKRREEQRQTKKDEAVGEFVLDILAKFIPEEKENIEELKSSSFFCETFGRALRKHLNS